VGREHVEAACKAGAPNCLASIHALLVIAHQRSSTALSFYTGVACACPSAHALVHKLCGCCVEGERTPVHAGFVCPVPTLPQVATLPTLPTLPRCPHCPHCPHCLGAHTAAGGRGDQAGHRHAGLPHQAAGRQGRTEARRHGSVRPHEGQRGPGSRGESGACVCVCVCTCAYHVRCSPSRCWRLLGGASAGQLCVCAPHVLHVVEWTGGRLKRDVWLCGARACPLR